MGCDHNQGEWVLCDKPHGDLGQRSGLGSGAGVTSAAKPPEGATPGKPTRHVSSLSPVWSR